MFRIENRHQDSGWEDAEERFATLDEAVWRASRMSVEPMAYGMARVVEVATGRVVITFPAGA